MSQPHVSSTSPSFFGHPNTLLQFQSLGHDTDDGDADWAGPARENGANGGPVLGPKSFGRVKASAEAAAADRIENLKLTNGFHWQFDQYTTLGL